MNKLYFIMDSSLRSRTLDSLLSDPFCEGIWNLEPLNKTHELENFTPVQLPLNARISLLAHTKLEEFITFIKNERDSFLKVLIQNKKLKIVPNSLESLFIMYKKFNSKEINKSMLVKYFNAWTKFKQTLTQIENIQDVTRKINELDSLKKSVLLTCRQDSYTVVQPSLMVPNINKDFEIVHVFDEKVDVSSIKQGMPILLPFRAWNDNDTLDSVEKQGECFSKQFLVCTSIQKKDIFFKIVFIVNPEILPGIIKIFGIVTHIRTSNEISKICNTFKKIDNLTFNMIKFASLKTHQFANILDIWKNSLNTELDQRKLIKELPSNPDQNSQKTSPAHTQLKLKRKKRVKMPKALPAEVPSLSMVNSPSKDLHPLKEIEDGVVYQHFLRIFNQGKEKTTLIWTEVEKIAKSLGFSIEQYGYIRVFKFEETEKIISQPIEQLAESMIKRRLDQKHRSGLSEKSPLNEQEINNIKKMFESCGLNPNTVVLKQK